MYHWLGREQGIGDALRHAGTKAGVKRALYHLQMSTRNVLGTDGHRLHLRHVGVSYRRLFGVPLLWTTPNVADVRSPLLVLMQDGKTLGAFRVLREGERLGDDMAQSMSSSDSIRNGFRKERGSEGSK